MKINLLAILAALLVLAAVVVAFVSYPGLVPLVLVGAAITFAILTLKE